MQNLIVTFILVAAVVFLGVRLRAVWRNRNAPSCGGGCVGCGSISDCSSPSKNLPLDEPPSEPQ